MTSKFPGGAGYVTDQIRAPYLACDWRKSSWSAHNGNCVEVARMPGAVCAVRDSKDQGGPVLMFPVEEWKVFLSNVKSNPSLRGEGL
jgi:Domain of unknown function (DUF397)